MLSNPWKSYRQVATQTAPPGQLVLMLFDGAIRFLEGARAGFNLDDPVEFVEAVHNNVVRAQQIIHELNMSLNMEAGGEFATRMRGLYLYMDRTLLEANVKKDPEGIEDVLKRLGIIRDAWRGMLMGETVEMEQAAA
jgi:flagellar secretion chaperone FliS